MSDNLGTLAGLIADLEELHKSQWRDAEEPSYHHHGDYDCPVDWESWPCPTIELVRKHKRAMYVIEPSGNGYGVFTKTIYGSTHPLDYKPRKTVAECEAWIEKQVNG